MRVLLLFFIVFFQQSIFSAAEDISDPHEYVRSMAEKWIKETLKNNDGKNLRFSAKNIIVENGNITFIVPKINQMGIDHGRAVNMGEEKNFLGFTRKKLVYIQNGILLCKNLGFGQLIESIVQAVPSSVYRMTYAPDPERGTWVSRNTYNIMGSGKLNLIRYFTCRISSLPGPR